MAAIRRSETPERHELRSWRDFTPMNTSLGTMLHNRTGSWRFMKPIYQDKVPPCQNACPAGNDIEGLIGLIQKGEYQRAYWHLKREQPFPAILGRVCFKYCEKACNRTALDGCVGINELERFVGDHAALSTPHHYLPAYNGKSLAVVGSGPAGMAAAYFSRLLGFKVTIFEKLPEMGGILRVGIPNYRLPREILAAEFERLRNMGIELRPGIPVGEVMSINRLFNAYDYVFLATGAHTSKKLELPGAEQSSRIMSGLSMLKKVALAEQLDLGNRVVVIGGGNTAIDAARTAIRLGCDVTVTYRRSEREMPAHPAEVRLAREEGVELRTLVAPERVQRNENGTIGKLICCRMKPGPLDDSGRRRPIKMEGAFLEVETDSILIAVGELPNLDYLRGILGENSGVLQVNERLEVNAKTDGRCKIFAGGDMTSTPHTVIDAVASGKKAAIAMDCDRKGVNFTEVLNEIAIGSGAAISFSKYMGMPPLNSVSQNHRLVVGSEHIVFHYFKKVRKIEEEFEAGYVRKRSFEEYRIPFTEEELQMESSRCIHCGRCTECDNCLIFCPDMSVLANDGSNFGYAINYDYCKGCGICYTECPRYAITMIEQETPVDKGD